MALARLSLALGLAPLAAGLVLNLLMALRLLPASLAFAFKGLVALLDQVSH